MGGSGGSGGSDGDAVVRRQTCGFWWVPCASVTNCHFGATPTPGGHGQVKLTATLRVDTDVWRRWAGLWVGGVSWPTENRLALGSGRFAVAIRAVR